MNLHSIKWDGRQISKPGLYSNIPIDTYHSPFICAGDRPLPEGIKLEGIKTFGPSISSSGLRKIFHDSPAHFYCEWRGNPNAVAPENKPHFRIGRAVHHLMLGEKFFHKLFAVQPEEWPDEHGVIRLWNNNRNVCRKWNAERAREGRDVLTKSDVNVIKNLVVSLQNNPIIQAGALNGLIERSLFWKDKETGIWLKARPDSIPNDSGDFVDLKTTHSTNWRDMVRTIEDNGYYQQGALICEGARTVLKINNPTFTLIFAEKKPPYWSRVVHVKDNDLKLGSEANRWAIDKFAECLKSGEWPGPGGYQQDAVGIEISEIARKNVEDRIKYGV